jgi:hypothetical protein
LSLFIMRHEVMTTYGGGVVPRIPTQLGGAERLTSHLGCFTRGEKPHMDRLHNLYRAQKYVLPLLGIEYRYLGFPARILIATSTEICQLLT